MMKDRGLKAQLLRFFVRNGWYPQLEVDVTTEENATASLKLITDIDILGMIPSSSGLLMPILGDCKTLKGQSPINRVIWLRGLMDLWSADNGMILLQKQIEADHKQLSETLGITLLSENEFVVYAKAFDKRMFLSYTALSDMAVWELYEGEMSKFPSLDLLYRYKKYGYWNEKSYAKNIRSLIFHLRKYRGELNPSNKAHLTFVYDLLSMFALSINGLVIKLFNRYTLPESKKNFDAELKVLIWGGYDNYKFLNEVRMKSAIDIESELELPEWERFVNMVRNFIDAPLQTTYTPILLKEIAYEFLVDGKTYEHIINSHEVKTGVLLAQYLFKATRLPDEFTEIITQRLMRIPVGS